MNKGNFPWDITQGTTKPDFIKRLLLTKKFPKKETTIMFIFHLIKIPLQAQ